MLRCLTNTGKIMLELRYIHDIRNCLGEVNIVHNIDNLDVSLAKSPKLSIVGNMNNMSTSRNAVKISNHSRRSVIWSYA